MNLNAGPNVFENRLIFHWKAHLFISFRSLNRLLAILSCTLRVENRDVSLAKNLGLHWTLSDESLTCIKNKRGPIEPWGTPALILNQDQLWSLRITLWFLFLSKSAKRLNKFPEIPLRLSLWIISSCHTLLKAFEMSRNTPLTCH